jgi:natural product biosynthesis luciferase-like monooxygenase protein
VKFGLFYLPVLSEGESAARKYESIMSEIRVADELGWEVAWFAEHHGDSYGGVVPSIAVLGTAVAMQTRRIHVGAAVTVLPLHHPLRVAEEYAMLDVLSNGRVELGLGRGFMPHEFRPFGVDFDTRQGPFAEGLEVVRRAWTKDEFSYAGQHYNIDKFSLYPRPLQAPHPPMWMAAALSQQSFETAGRLGFNLLINPYTRTREEVGRGLDWYKEAYASAGHDVSKRRILVHEHMYVAPTEEQAREEPREALMWYLRQVDRAFLRSNDRPQEPLNPTAYETMYPDKVLFGTPDSVEQRIREWEPLGITDFCFMTQFGNLDPRKSLASLRLFSEEVMPRFKAGAAGRPRLLRTARANVA